MARNSYFLLIALWSAASFAGVFRYRLPAVPFNSVDACHAEAKTLGQELAQQTGVQILSSQCSTVLGGEQLDILIEYESDSKISMVSYGDQGGLIDPKTFYKTQADCLADSPAQLKLFSLSTALPVFYSYCFNSGYSSGPVWGLRIDGIGEPHWYPWSESLFTDVRITQPTPTVLREEISNYLDLSGAILSNIVFRPSMPSNRITFVYYRLTPLDFRTEFFYSHPSMETCQTQLKAFKEISTKSRIGLVTAYCGSSIPSMKSFDLVVASEGNRFRLVNSAETFKDYATCREKLPGLVAKYQTLRNANIVGGICSSLLGEKTYRVRLVERRPLVSIEKIENRN